MIDRKVLPNLGSHTNSSKQKSQKRPRACMRACAGPQGRENSLFDIVLGENIIIIIWHCNPLWVFAFQPGLSNLMFF
jgi:hypothetical protein